MIRYLSQERPIFLQIADMLKDAILSGAYAEDSQIPSITELSVACNINPATALKGVSLLVEEGLLFKKRGLGMFVSQGARQALIRQRRESFYRDYIEPMIREARHLEINSGELMEMTERGIREHGDRNQ